MKRFVKLFEEHVYDAVFRASVSSPTNDMEEIKDAIRLSPYFKEFVSYGFSFIIGENEIIVSLRVGDTTPLTPEAKLYVDSNNGDWVAIRIKLNHKNIICKSVKRDLTATLQDGKILIHDGDGETYIGDELNLFEMKGYGVTAFDPKETDMVKKYERLMEVLKNFLDRTLWDLNKDGHFKPIKSTENLGQAQVDRSLSNTVNDLW